jgi:2,4-dichlorophenol 6-monooxygenase
MNQRYASAAVVPEPEVGEEVWERDRELYLQATTRPGAKIPHAWLINAKGRRVSTLDVTGKGQFSVVTGLAGGAWAEAAAQLDRPYLRVVVTGARARRTRTANGSGARDRGSGRLAGASGWHRGVAAQRSGS